MSQGDPALKIVALEARVVTVPMAPHRTASVTVVASPLVLVSVTTEAGHRGDAILFTYTPIAQKPCAEFITGCAALVVGKELSPTAISDALHARFRLLGTQGIAGMALAGIDMALWDAFAKSREQALHVLLGGETAPLKYYGSIGMDGAEGSAREAERWARQGALGVKAKIGYASLDEDVAVIRAMRDAVGPDVSLMVDYNQCLSAAEAARRLRQLDVEGLHWIEEPILAHDWTGLERLRREIRTPIQCGENWWGPLDFRHAVETGVRDLFMADVMKAGGVTGWIRVSALAQTYGITLSTHLWPEISSRLLLTSPNAGWVEYSDWWNPILTEPLRLEGGVVRVDEAPGTGVTFDDVAVERYAGG
ncbi:mandelate racemase [Rhizobacter sp. Root404]|nr:mandelate racemase [Rhizobacter sp. Root404]